MGKNNLSAGRVQTPALKLLVDREKLILAFVPEEYWLVKGIFTKEEQELIINNSTEKELKDNDKTLLEDGLYLELTSYDSKRIDRINEFEEVLSILNNISKDLDYKISKITNKKTTVKPKPPFTTSTLQQSASSNLGYVPKNTMRLAQKLYEGLDIDGSPTALITYMRTDSVNLSIDAVDSIREFIKEQYPQTLPEKANIYFTKAKNTQEAHEAIRPVNILLTPTKLKNKLEPELWKLYDLIWKQTVTCQMLEEKRELMSIELSNQYKCLFSGSVSWTIFEGFKVLFPELIIKKPENINFKEGESLNLNTLNLFQKFTQPPGRYSQASLIKELEELGIGRPSTYANIIATLQDREYVEKGPQMKPTILGIKTLELLEKFLPNLVSAELTATMEDKLDAIANGKDNYKSTLQLFWGPLKATVDQEMGNIGGIRQEFSTIVTDELCPTCNSAMDLKLGRFGDYFQCKTTVEHRFTKNYREYDQAVTEAKEKYDDQTIGKKCEKCAKNLIVRVAKASLNPYIACPDYLVGNKHTVTAINFGPCPECQKNSREGVLVKKKGFRGTSFVGCSLDKTVCGYIKPKE